MSHPPRAAEHTLVGADLDHEELSLDNRIIPPAKGKPNGGVPGAALGKRCLPSKCHTALRGN